MRHRLPRLSAATKRGLTVPCPRLAQRSPVRHLTPEAPIRRRAAGVLAFLAGAAPALAQSNSCVTATPVGTGTFGGTTVGMTADGTANCGLSAGTPDVWFSFAAAANGTLLADTCGSAYDTVLSVHSACPGTALNQIACDDDGCGLSSAVRARVTTGHTYYIRVSGYSGATGPFLLHLALGPAVGPDVWVVDLAAVQNFGALNGITAYAVGTEACNQGDAPANWVNTTSQHPAIAQNMFRLKAGRFEQIGQSWVKHAFFSINGQTCRPCQIPPLGGAQLGVNCSNPYAVAQNGSQSILGPRSQVNATTGVFPYPFTAPGFSGPIDRRLQVSTADIDPAQNAGALYFVEGHYITADDAGAGNGLNNASYRQITIPSTTGTPMVTGATHAQDPAIKAWREQDPGVTIVEADYFDAAAAITARFWVAARATDNGNGTWHYEYALYNHNASRNGGTFTVPVPAGTTVSNPGFHAPFSHSGEPFDNTAWSSAVNASGVTWSTTPYTTNANANAIRWGTLYNFRFDADTAPTTGSATLGLHTTGSPSSLVVAGLPVPGTACFANCDGSTTAPVLNVLDFACFLNKFAAGDPYANCDNSTTPPVFNVLDFACFLNKFAAGCS